jgi:uncharacterized Rmd1/YagE family protein
LTGSTGKLENEQRRVKETVLTLTEAREIARGRMADAVAKSLFEQSVEPLLTVMTAESMKWMDDYRGN